MFDKNELALLDDAIASAVRILRRSVNEKPRFAEVAERDLASYTALSAKLKGMAHETPKAPSKG